MVALNLCQHVVRDSIADFYCHELRLIIEVDGEAHHSPIQQERDDERDFQLAAYGYCTVRVSNAEVLTDLDAVCKDARPCHTSRSIIYSNDAVSQ
ncbi:MAG: DUF559 domain-containing protein [Ignavibacteria bacterium]|nr:DUF559 domain-containing protein [Ignavibacteria bacterium]